MISPKWVSSTVLTTIVALSLGTAAPAAAQPNPCPGDDVVTAVDYANFVDCILQLIHDDDFALLPPDDQLALQDYSAIFEDAKQQLTLTVINDLIPSLPAGDISDFENVVQNSFILQEMDALQVLLESTLDADKKKEAKKQGEDSVKALLKKLAERAPWGLGAFIETLIEVINEILAVIRG